MTDNICFQSNLWGAHLTCILQYTWTCRVLVEYASAKKNLLILFLESAHYDPSWPPKKLLNKVLISNC